MRAAIVLQAQSAGRGLEHDLCYLSAPKGCERRDGRVPFVVINVAHIRGNRN